MKKMLFVVVLLCLGSSCRDNPAEPEPAAALNITSTPDGAAVKLDGINKGVTPLLIPEVQLGTHSIQLNKYDYEELNDEIDITSAELISRRYTLELGSGILNISSIPENAVIYIDNDSIGLTPLLNYSLKAGGYSILLSKEPYYDIHDSVSVHHTITDDLSFDLTRIPLISGSGTAELLDGRNAVGQSGTFTNIETIYFFVDINGSNSDNWQLKVEWYRDGNNINESQWSLLFDAGTVDFFWGSYSPGGNFLAGDYVIKIYVRENSFPYLMLEIPFTVA